MQLSMFYNTDTRPYSEQQSNCMEMEYQVGRKPRFLCFHGYRTSGKILERELQQWPEFVREKMDLVFTDAPFPAQGPPIPPAAAEGNFDPPYYEWFQSNEDFSEYMNFDECIAYIEDCMTRIGPFDGLLGFSQGALLSAALPGMQTEMRKAWRSCSAFWRRFRNCCRTEIMRGEQKFVDNGNEKAFISWI
ncbi:hypothetical protein ACSBR2_008987 [Camellia fascicularis]